ncbi:MAG: class I SAM-dependent methyltransferase [Chloroflexi bacterium]|nr:class I SAM-dependent methyltransferase [Chloroflexota bacterium]
MRLLEVKAGERVLDLGCGQGVVSRAMHKAGATVTGVDMSRRLIELARRRSSRDIQYLVADARDLKALERGSFDAIAWVLAAQDTEPIEPVFINCARLLRPGGRLVMVINHPAFRIPRQSRWGFDEERKLLYRAVDRYLTPLSIPIDIHPFRAPARQQTWTYHRPLEAYIKGLAGEGLWVNALEEWPSHRVSQPGPLAAAENRSREEFPLFLALRAVRVPQERSV